MKVPKPNLSSLWRRQDRPAEPVEIDPADMGTCFGLEMSIDPLPPTAGEPATPHWWERSSARKAFGA